MGVLSKKVSEGKLLTDEQAVEVVAKAMREEDFRGRKVLLMCGNNLPNDPAYVWVVLAHESAHVMQYCKGGPLMPAALLSEAMDQARLRSPDAFHELRLYHSSVHQVEVEARLVQALPPAEVEALFHRHCGSRFGP